MQVCFEVRTLVAMHERERYVTMRSHENLIQVCLILLQKKLDLKTHEELILSRLVVWYLHVTELVQASQAVQRVLQPLLAPGAFQLVAVDISRDDNVACGGLKQMLLRVRLNLVCV
jgi:hypothetical protein